MPDSQTPKHSIVIYIQLIQGFIKSARLSLRNTFDLAT